MSIQIATPTIAAFDDAEKLRNEAYEYAEASRSEATRRAYDLDWRSFYAFCESRGINAMPAAVGTVVAYATWLAGEGRAVATITRRIIVIGGMHKKHGFESPASAEIVKTVLKGIRREVSRNRSKDDANREHRGKEALSAADLVTILDSIPDTPTGKRDKAIIIVGFCGALRRSEIAELQVEWITKHRLGLRIRLPRSKTDQEGKGAVVFLERDPNTRTCPVMILEAHLAASNISSGPVFRKIDQHGNVYSKALDHGTITRIVQRYVKGLHGDDAARSYGAHSLRAGFATALNAQGVSTKDIMLGGRWKSHEVALSYMRGDRESVTLRPKFRD